MIQTKTKELSTTVGAVHEIQVVLSSSDGKTTHGLAMVREFSQHERWKRAVKVLGLSWALSLVSVLIPLAHFFLVPSFLLAGPFVAIHIYKTKKMLVGGTCTCPDCGKAFSIVKAPLKWPLADLCAACLNSVSIRPVTDSDEIEIVS